MKKVSFFSAIATMLCVFSLFTIMAYADIPNVIVSGAESRQNTTVDKAATSSQFPSTGSGWLNYQSGGSIYIPKSFAVTNYSGNSLSEGYVYEFCNTWQQMYLTTAEYGVGGQEKGSNLLLNNYYQLVRVLPEATYNDFSDHAFTLSGYSGNNIYYIHYTLDHGTLYTIEFNYPTANRKVCDMYVESICDSFSTTGFVAPGEIAERPSPADFDIIYADINYPNYSWMYLDEYKNAIVSYDKAVYCFKDPDNDVWRNGNFFTVNRGTAVTVLAESEGYACVILTGTNKCGWINQKYLQAKNTSQTQVSNSMNAMLSDGEYSCIIDWTLNARLADYYLSFKTGGKTYTYPMDSQITITVYGWGQDGYHEIAYTCEELDRDRYDDHYDFMPGNSSEANITIKNGTITSLSIRYAE